MKLSKYVKLVKGGGYCMVAHVEDSGIWLGTRSAIFRATELPDDLVRVLRILRDAGCTGIQGRGWVYHDQ